jgi:hypothetical protein
MLALAPSNAVPTWRTVYAIGRAFEKVLAGASLEYLEQLLRTSPAKASTSAEVEKQLPETAAVREAQAVEDSMSKLPKKRKGRGERSDAKGMSGVDSAPFAAATAPPQQVMPSAPEALALLWNHFMAGQEAFISEKCHPWVLAVSLRTLDAHLSRCTPASAKSISQPSLWMGTNSTGTVTVSAPSLLRGLEALLSADRLEREPTNAPLCVRALCTMTRLLLLRPDLMPEGSWEDGGAAQAAEAADGDKSDGEDEASDITGEADQEPGESDDAPPADEEEPSKSDDVAAGDKEEITDKSGNNSKPDMSEDEEEPEKTCEESEDEAEVVIEGGELEGCRQMENHCLKQSMVVVSAKAVRTLPMANILHRLCLCLPMHCPWWTPFNEAACAGL